MPNEMRNRLIELMREAKEHPEKTCPRWDLPTCGGCDYNKGDECDRIARLADFLLKNGVIVPPCKVGDKVYLPCVNDWGDIENYTITEFVLDNNGLCFVVDDEDRECHSVDNIGKTVFLNIEEAEQALKEGTDNAV